MNCCGIGLTPISDQQSPLANLEYPFAISDIANAAMLQIGDRRMRIANLDSLSNLFTPFMSAPANVA
jgi:hypothetical protein